MCVEAHLSLAWNIQMALLGPMSDLCTPSARSRPTFVWWDRSPHTKTSTSGFRKHLSMRCWLPRARERSLILLTPIFPATATTTTVTTVRIFLSFVVRLNRLSCIRIELSLFVFRGCHSLASLFLLLPKLYRTPAVLHGRSAIRYVQSYQPSTQHRTDRFQLFVNAFYSAFFFTMLVRCSQRCADWWNSDAGEVSC